MCLNILILEKYVSEAQLRPDAETCVRNNTDVSHRPDRKRTPNPFRQ
ncbi:MAG: hypothetical protein LBP34_07450 [Flavobacteriaceae bacterium]|jgi:hypothetical protein|nr:hypothetical protein [Flavobacteriaceae bacterium]